MQPASCLTGDTLLIHFRNMATAKKRINISLSKELEQQIIALAKRDQVPTATKLAELVRESVELEEDRLLSAEVEKRRAAKGKTYSHEEVWG